VQRNNHRVFLAAAAPDSPMETPISMTFEQLETMLTPLLQQHAVVRAIGWAVCIGSDVVW
jgi:hypothetical protein